MVVHLTIRSAHWQTLTAVLRDWNMREKGETEEESEACTLVSSVSSRIMRLCLQLIFEEAAPSA